MRERVAPLRGHAARRSARRTAASRSEATIARVIRVFLVDDQALVRSGFRMLIEAEDDLEVVGEAADGQDALVRLRTHPPDVVLMDVRMPGLTGSRRPGVCWRQLPPARVLILTTFDLDEYVFAALQAGASGSLLKDAPPPELLSGSVSWPSGVPGWAPSAPPAAGHVVPPAPGAPGPVARASSPRGKARCSRRVAPGATNTEIGARCTGRGDRQDPCRTDAVQARRPRPGAGGGSTRTRPGSCDLGRIRERPGADGAAPAEEQPRR